jgi:hypoxanthine phosphoribosyltransferase
MIVKFMADKLIISFDEYNKIVEKLAIEIHKKYKPTVLVGIMRGAAPILDILSRILKLPTCLYCYSELLRRGNGR